jgi:hypothetical protein
MTRTYKIGGIETVSRIDSYLYWRRRAGDRPLAELSSFTDGLCNHCKGWMLYIDEKTKDRYRCLCRMLGDMQIVAEAANDMRIWVPTIRMEAIKPWGTQESKEQIKGMVDYLKGWLLRLDSWVLICGNPGTGKTMTLQALKNALGAFAFYIPAPKLAQEFYLALDGNTFSDTVDSIKRVPILLLDDIGAEHKTDFMIKTLHSIIDFRYSLAEEFVTVVSSNLWSNQLDNFSPTISDRLQDKRVTTTIELTRVASYRRKE